MSFHKCRSRLVGIDGTDALRPRELEGENGKLKRPLTRALLVIESRKSIPRGTPQTRKRGGKHADYSDECRDIRALGMQADGGLARRPALLFARVRQRHDGHTKHAFELLANALVFRRQKDFSSGPQRMPDEARNHHYIPKSYLNGFAERRGRRQWHTNVTDLVRTCTYRTNTANVCRERDFLRIDADGHPPDALEKAMSNFESVSLPAVRRVAESGDFADDDANLVLNLMALLAVRSPESREKFRKFHEDVSKISIDISLSSKETWEKQAAKMEESGFSTNGLTYEELKARYKPDEYRVTLSRGYQIGTEFKMFDSVLQCLSLRSWTILKADGPDSEFVTTNRPVVLTFVDPMQVPLLYRHSPGFGLQNTEVFFPLTRQAMLVGRFKRAVTTRRIDRLQVAALNSHMIAHSYGKVFSRRKEFLYLNPLDHSVQQDGLLLERAASWRKQTESQ